MTRNNWCKKDYKCMFKSFIKPSKLKIFTKSASMSSDCPKEWICYKDTARRRICIDFRNWIKVYGLSKSLFFFLNLTVINPKLRGFSRRCCLCRTKWRFVFSFDQWVYYRSQVWTKIIAWKRKMVQKQFKSFNLYIRENVEIIEQAILE